MGSCERLFLFLFLLLFLLLLLLFLLFLLFLLLLLLLLLLLFLQNYAVLDEFYGSAQALQVLSLLLAAAHTSIIICHIPTPTHP